MGHRSLILIFAVILAGCTPPEKLAYETIVGANAYIKSMAIQHPECAAGSSANVCLTLARARAAKDALIDVTETLCAGPNFNAGGACDFPKKGTPGYQQASAKLSAAIANFNQAKADLKAVAGTR